MNEDDSKNDPHPEAGLFHGQMVQISGPEDDHDLVTGVQAETRNDHDMVTRVQAETRNSHEMVTGATEQIGDRYDMTGVHEEVTYCYPSTSSRKQKKNRSTNQPKFRSEKTLRRSRQTKFCWPSNS